MPLAETAKLRRNTSFREEYQYLLSLMGLKPAHLFQFAKKKARQGRAGARPCRAVRALFFGILI
jgi:hypothetical protein